ncbi:TPR-like protein [Coniochaeta ligniaria NRRL 30616]|uniref:TPR-like protein n=1 Tax=Coniochaeta ligniaria NRRL 30616 TaxID=1408157 RepID=A0A1J7IXU9_9PEZI|nr:TPR-like protein [Coniochaeta ligniaria NRRL 30616]
MGSSVAELTRQVRSGQYEDVLTSVRAQDIISEFAASLLQQQASEDPANPEHHRDHSRLAVGLAAFNAFLQTNVTGPVLRDAARIDVIFHEAAKSACKSAAGSLASLRKACFASLDVDGVSPYPYIPSIELFCLARYVFTGYAPESASLRFPAEATDGEKVIPGPSLRWHALRVCVWHYKLLTQPSLGPGSLFNKSHQWSDIPTLEQHIQTELAALEEDIKQGRSGVDWSVHDKARFWVEKANICIMLGQDKKAKAALKEATEISQFKYVLSGALGRRTKFQETSISQLVVLAKSAPASTADGTHREGEPQAVPQALPLNDDTLLESVAFTGKESEEAVPSGLPDELKDMSPEEQPQLDPVDQIILLTEATLKDAFSPTDSLTSEEILPFATRVISDKSTNWQIYTHALLLRSRIEFHRSRTVERGVLQLQAVVDQVIVDTTAPTTEEEQKVSNGSAASPSTVPTIEVSGPDGENAAAVTRQPNKPTSFFPAAKSTDSAPAQVRLEYIHALSSPPRWHLESELAYAWAGVGSLVSALEIFKRLRLWAEVALCLASTAASDDEDGRGSGGEDKAKAILRWRLFHRTDGVNPSGDPDDEFGPGEVDVSELKAADYHGPERDPPPPNAPRLLCILGDIEDTPKHYERAWVISKNRFARAQRSLGEYYLKRKDWTKGRESYQKAVAANRLNPELWNRLGDIYLRLGEFSDAAEAFQRAISSANDVVGGEDARTWSNLGSALYSLYVERVKEVKKEREERKQAEEQEMQPSPEPEAQEQDVEQSSELFEADKVQRRDPSVLLSQSLAAYKRGASIANDNWRIWDNVITLAARMRPPPILDILFALRHIIRIRNSEDVLDIDVLRLLLNEAVLSQEKPESGASSAIYEPPRGSNERAVCELLETVVVPLITNRSDLWELIARERVWRRDYAGAIDAAERAWRAAVGGAGVGLAASAASVGDGKSNNWLEDRDAWERVVERTEELVSTLENYGPEVPEVGAKWKFKARNAIRSVMGKARGTWEGSKELERLQDLMEGLR